MPNHMPSGEALLFAFVFSHIAPEGFSKLPRNGSIAIQVGMKSGIPT